MAAHDRLIPPARALADVEARLRELEERLDRERAARREAEMRAVLAGAQLREKERQVELLERVATKSNQGGSVEAVLRFAVEAVSRHVRSVMGNVYLLQPGEVPRLVPSGIMHVEDPEGLDEFLRATAVTTFTIGLGLPGRVWRSGQAAWICDVTSDPNFLRAKAAEASGIHGAFAFPVLVGDEVLAVVEFFFKPVLEVDEALLYVMGQIGTQLGRVMERRRAEQRLVHDATHDHLTGLPNRHLFLDRLERAVALHRQRPEEAFAVVFVDLDRFKLVNDSLGHAAGDALLLEIAGRLSAVLGRSDGGSEAGPSAVLARLGGDEFTVLLEGLAHPGQAIEAAERMQDALRRPLTIEGQEVYTSASFGVALSDARYAAAADLMRDADLAMYRAKAEGRARVEIFDRALHEAAARRLTLESDLRGALDRGEFRLHYQPIVSLGTGRIVGFEALVRWLRADGRMVPPGDFIAVAEETGLIAPLGHWVLREALATLASWQRDHPGEEPLTMSVNVSPRQFHQASFVEQVGAALCEVALAPGTVKLEITEGVMIRDAARTADVLGRLRALGVRISIDDFGTGYSSLSYLHRLPCDTLKVDRSFVLAMRDEGSGGKMVKTILDMAGNLGMAVIAEGVETSDHASQLRAMGCGYAQGYHFSRPVDEAAATALVRGR